jgi:hypothetical protein
MYAPKSESTQPAQLSAYSDHNAGTENSIANTSARLGECLLSNCLPNYGVGALGNLKTLPAELWLHVFSYSDVPAIKSLRLVNRSADAFVKTELKHFKVSSREDLKTVLKNYPKIESLTLRENIMVYSPDYFTDDDIKLIPHTIKFLDVSLCHQLTDKAFKDWQSPPESLYIGGSRGFTDGVFSHWSSPPKHLGMSVSTYRFTDKVFAHWAVPPESLHNDTCFGFTDHVFAHWTAAPEFLYARATGLTSGAFAHWAVQPNILLI